MTRNLNYMTLALALSLLLSPTFAFAQAAPLSDYLQLTVTDQTGQDVIPPMNFTIDEPVGAPDPGEPPMTVIIPGVTVDFMESIAAGGLVLSDRFHMDPVVVIVSSADLKPRDPAVATRIPGSALETFSPLSIFAFSDGDEPNPTAVPSDTLRVIQGSYAGTTGHVVFDGVIDESDSETIPEPVLSFLSPPVFFDVEEPLYETGGVPDIISDWVDVDVSQGFFLSSDNPLDYENYPGGAGDIRGTLVEDLVAGGSLQYTLTFVSDAIPEPSSLMSLCIGLLSATLLQRSSRCRRR